MKYLLFVIFLSFLCSGKENKSANEQNSECVDSFLIFSSNFLTHIYNTEYDNAYREGEPFFGSYAKGRFTLCPLRNVDFSLGVFVRKEFGDEAFFSDARPLLRARYRNKGFSVILGELLSENRHGLLDALLREEFMYRPAVEEGLQLLYKGRLIHQDFWVVYSALNSKEQREHLSAGNCTFTDLGPVRLSLMGYVDHYGGQLFAPENDPVRDNLTGAAGITFRYELSSPLNEIGAEQFFIGSYTTENRSENAGYDDGWGSISRVWAGIFGFMCRFHYYKGHEYVSWEGNHLYKSNGSYYNFQFSRTTVLPRNVCIDFGVRLEFVEINPSEYADNGEHVMWVQLKWDFEKILK